MAYSVSECCVAVSSSSKYLKLQIAFDVPIYMTEPMRVCLLGLWLLRLIYFSAMREKKRVVVWLSNV